MVTETTIRKGVEKASKFINIIGILAMVLGIIAIAYPLGFGKVTATVIGAVFVIGGILRFIFAIASVSIGSMLMRYLYAVLMVIVGCYIIANPEMGLKVITMAMAIYFIIDGLTEIIYSFSLRPIGGGIYLLVGGIISIILGGLIFSNWPESSNYMLGIYLGIKLLIDGTMLTATGSAIRKFSKLE